MDTPAEPLPPTLTNKDSKQMSTIEQRLYDRERMRLSREYDADPQYFMLNFRLADCRKLLQIGYGDHTSVNRLREMVEIKSMVLDRLMPDAMAQATTAFLATVEELSTRVEEVENIVHG